jgi:DNA-binding NarL/FixJ family response regulator
VLALTAYEDRGYLKQMVSAGASGYVLKRTAADVLLQAIRDVAGGREFLDPSIASPVLEGRREFNGGNDVPLSERESEVLKRIVKGFSNKQIAGELNLSVKTVETYKSRAQEKLGLFSRVDLVRYAIQKGWLTQ